MKKTRSKKSRDTVPLKRQCHEIILFKKNIHSFVVVVATMEIMYEDEYTGFFLPFFKRFLSHAKPVAFTAEII